MKKLLLLLALLCVTGVQANDISVLYPDTINASDTDGVRFDTVYSARFVPSKFPSYWFKIQIDLAPDGRNDTNFASDTLQCYLQQSYNGFDWSALKTMSDEFVLGGNDTTVAVSTNLHPDTVYTEPYWRFMWIYTDSITGGTALVGNIYYKNLKVWINGVE